MFKWLAVACMIFVAPLPPFPFCDTTLTHPEVSQSLQLVRGSIKRIPAVTATAFPAHSPVDVTLGRGRS